MVVWKSIDTSTIHYVDGLSILAHSFHNNRTEWELCVLGISESSQLALSYQWKLE